MLVTGTNPSKQKSKGSFRISSPVPDIPQAYTLCFRLFSIPDSLCSQGEDDMQQITNHVISWTLFDLIWRGRSSYGNVYSVLTFRRGVQSLVKGSSYPSTAKVDSRWRLKPVPPPREPRTTLCGENRFPGKLYPKMLALRRRNFETFHCVRFCERLWRKGKFANVADKNCPTNTICELRYEFGVSRKNNVRIGRYGFRNFCKKSMRIVTFISHPFGVGDSYKISHFSTKIARIFSANPSGLT